MRIENEPPEITSEYLKVHFQTNNSFFAPRYVSSVVCDGVVGDLTNNNLVPLPTDGGGIYSAVEGELPHTLVRTADSLGLLVAKAAGLSVDFIKPSIHEVVKYSDGSSLSLHRDSEGDSVSKILVTLSGSARFQLDGHEFLVKTGDLLIMRGREFVDTPTPVHGTSDNFNRHVLLVEPNYIDPRIPRT